MWEYCESLKTPHNYYLNITISVESKILCQVQSYNKILFHQQHQLAKLQITERELVFLSKNIS